ncbi:MAG: hypothetical protein ACAF41_14045 [Leptolyngbya sp. BL-A-14]
MLQPLTQDLRFPFAEGLVESYGLYLEQLTKDDKYGLIGILAFWLREEAEAEYTMGVMHVTDENLKALLSEYCVSSAVEVILKKYLSQMNEPAIQSLITALVRQLREGYYRRREIDELEDIRMVPYCDFSDDSSFSEEEMSSLDSEKD